MNGGGIKTVIVVVVVDQCSYIFEAFSSIKKCKSCNKLSDRARHKRSEQPHSLAASKASTTTAVVA